MAQTKEKTYLEMLDEAENIRKDFVDMWQTAENVYEGEYEPLIVDTNIAGFVARVKTHLLFDAIRKNLAMLMPPGYIEFIVEPSSDDQTDLNSAMTARSILEYTFNKRGGMEKLSEILTDFLLLNRGYARMGFKEADGIIPDEGEDKGDGQAFFERIKRKDFLISRGNISIDDAWCNGGWIARRFWAHIDWVLDNEKYKYGRNSRKADQIKPDAEWRGKHLDSDFDSDEGYSSSEDLKYVELWEIFEAPTKKKKGGKYTIFSKRQEKILYEADGMPFKGIKFPIREIVFFTPRDSYYAVPLANRSINPLLEHEWFETEKMRALAESFDLIAISGLASDEVESQIKGSQKNVKYLNNDGFKENPIQQVQVRIDTEPYTEGSLGARARFERMWGIQGSDERMQGGKIATEMVLQNKIFMSEMNSLKVRVNKFIEYIAQEILTINKDLMLPEMQMLITRSAVKTWSDHNEVTLEGNYSVTVKSKPLRDMTEGEYAKTIQMAMSTAVQLEQLPKYSPVINAVPLMKSFFEELDIPIVGVFNDLGPMADQNFENSIMLMEIPVNADPQHDHLEHLNDIGTLLQAIEQTGDQGRYSQKGLQMIAEHYQQHMQFLQQIQGGSAGAGAMQQQMNPTNNARSAQSEDVSIGAAGPQQLSQSEATT